MTRAISSLLGAVVAIAITAALSFAANPDGPPWPAEKEYPDLGPIHPILWGDPGLPSWRFLPRAHFKQPHNITPPTIAIENNNDVK